MRNSSWDTFLTLILIPSIFVQIYHGVVDVLRSWATIMKQVVEIHVTIFYFTERTIHIVRIQGQNAGPQPWQSPIAIWAIVCEKFVLLMYPQHAFSMPEMDDDKMFTKLFSHHLSSSSIIFLD